jgi:hypothetical protein
MAWRWTRAPSGRAWPPPCLPEPNCSVGGRALPRRGMQGQARRAATVTSLLPWGSRSGPLPRAPRCPCHVCAAQRWGRHSLWLHVDVRNTAARELYVGRGYRAVAYRTAWPFRRQLVMAKALPALRSRAEGGAPGGQRQAPGQAPGQAAGRGEGGPGSLGGGQGAEAAGAPAQPGRVFQWGGQGKEGGVGADSGRS